LHKVANKQTNNDENITFLGGGNDVLWKKEKQYFVTGRSFLYSNRREEGVHLNP